MRRTPRPVCIPGILVTRPVIEKKRQSPLRNIPVISVFVKGRQGPLVLPCLIANSGPAYFTQVCDTEHFKINVINRFYGVFPVSYSEHLDKSIQSTIELCVLNVC